jgi:starch-binding outer membrane protein, SusD/RagB family
MAMEKTWKGGGSLGRIGRTVALATLVVTGACDFDIIDTNAPIVEDLTESPDRATIARTAIGIAAQADNNLGTEIEFYALYGREGYNLQGNDPRETGEQIRGPQDPTGRNAGIWIGPYSAIRTIHAFLDAVDSAPATQLTATEVRAAAGYAKTLEAWHLHRLALRNGELGIPIDVDRPIHEEPAPFVSFDAAMAAVSALLDEALADLEAGGSAFPFTMSPGFAGFDTPATFAEFNRALAAKVLVHRATFVDCAECWGQASDALAESFITTAGLPGSLDDGVYYFFSSAAGEPANPVTEPLTSNHYWVHPSIVTGAQLRIGGEPDLRLTTKVMAAGRAREVNELVGTHKPVMFNSATNPAAADLGADVPWIINEELLLLRAEVRWNDGDRPGAIADLNLVRQHAGGLPPAAVTAASTDADFVTELLYNRLYSLMWTQGTRWIDARRYDRLSTLPVDREGDSLFENMAIPADECVARSLPVPCAPLG